MAPFELRRLSLYIVMETVLYINFRCGHLSKICIYHDAKVHLRRFIQFYGWSSSFPFSGMYMRTPYAFKGSPAPSRWSADGKEKDKKP